MKRRDVLRFGAASILGRAPHVNAARLRDRPPNVVLIISDEHTHSVAGCYGNRLARTPNIDQLAEEGITFDRAYCNSPICVPSRLSLTAGKHVHRVNAWNNFSRLASDDVPSLPQIMNRAGYESFLCGKQHYDRRHRYGFTEIVQSVNDHDMHGRGRRRAADDTAALPLHHHLREPAAGDDSRVLSHDRRVTESAIGFLSGRDAAAKPFFLLVGYIAPHPPFTVPAGYWEAHRGKPPMPLVPVGSLDLMPLNYKHLRRAGGVVDVPDSTVLRARELYYGLTQWMDGNTGRVLAALKQSPFADNTVVVYTTDHGEMLGEHGLWWKNCMYEQSVHIPLIVSWPRRWAGGQRRGGACSLVDLVQTIARLGGAAVPDDWDGKSMLEWMDNAAAPWRDIAVSQYYADKITSGFAMVRTGPWKYVYHTAPDERHPAERELYNLEADPQERRNLALGNSHRRQIAHLHAKIVSELGQDPEEIERRCRVEVANGYR